MTPTTTRCVLLEPPGQPPILEAYLVAMEPMPTSPPSLGLKFRFKATEDFDREFDIRDPWSFRLSAKARFAAGMEGSITPPFDVQLTPPGGQASVELTADLVGDAGGTPMTLLGKAGSTRLEATKIAAGFGFKTELDGTRANGEPVVRAEVRGGKLFIDLSEGDGFIQTILSGVRVESAFELGARWTPGEGVRFEGGAGLELVVPLHRSLGPVEIQTLYFLLGFAADPPITVGVAAAIGVQIGPFGMSVDKIGVDVPLRFPAERNGNLGALDLAFTFRPPTGAGLAIDAAVAVGGGYLSFDPQKEEYGGILQLEIAETIAVKAIGVADHADAGRLQGLLIGGHHFRGRLCPDPTGAWLCLDGHRRAAGDQPHVRRRGAARRAQEPHAGQRDVSERSDPQRAPNPQQPE